MMNLISIRAIVGGFTRGRENVGYGVTIVISLLHISSTYIVEVCLIIVEGREMRKREGYKSSYSFYLAWLTTPLPTLNL